MNILLISQTAIIKQIFNLISDKLKLNLTILDVNIVSKHFDIIIIEDKLFDENFPIRNFTTKIGIITKEKEKFSKKSDFILSKPFLPSILLSTIKQQLDSIELDKVQDSTNDKIDEDTEQIQQSEEFIETLVEDISETIVEESDESVVSSAFVNNGGILDTDELSKIQNILNDEIIDNKNEDNSIQEEDEWFDLSAVIDKAIDEIQQYHFKNNEPIKLILNQYTIDEVSPLLNKLDQNIVDSLVSGEEIVLKLKVEK